MKRKARSPTRTAFPANVARTDKPVMVTSPATIIDHGSRVQPHYNDWLAEHFVGQRCQSPWCIGHAEQLHHEPCGASKDDRSQAAICAQCHRDRHEGRLPAGYTLRQVRDAHEASAARNWRAYLAGEPC